MSDVITQSYEALVSRAAKVLEERGASEKIRIQVGSATCENAAGAIDVLDEVQKHIAASGRTDIVAHRTGCTGRCSREPIVGVLVPGRMPVKYECVTREIVHKIFTSHVLGGKPVVENVLDGPMDTIHEYEFLFCVNARCGATPKMDWREAFARRLEAGGISPSMVRMSNVTCLGACGDPATSEACTHIMVRPLNVLYRVCNEADMDEIIRSHLRSGVRVEHLAVEDEAMSRDFFDIYGDVAFFSKQSRIALRNCGVVDPESIDEYVHYHGFSAFAKALARDREEVLGVIKESNLRGRGGGGFPTALKWGAARRSEKGERYLICNADEGDPGAFMDRSMLESDPFSVVEGMLIGAYIIEATQGYFYIRAEYPLAIRRVEHAIEVCREYGLLGKNILGSGFDFDIDIRLGAGAFVCGEETALIHSIEGERGQPRIRPPFPTESGLWGKPTVINNVETFANIAAVLNYGGEWFARLGTEKSGGTKVFALVGKVRHTGLVEVPMGTTLRHVVFDIGGGVAGGKQLKAIQTGGPAGGCIPASALDTVVDYDTLMKAGSIMGSGGMIVLDESDCMVDIAKYFMTFSQDESCGKCTPCREGTTRILEILERITAGEGVPEDLVKLQRLGRLVKRSSLCGLGRAAPNPVLSTLEHFREEYEAHVVEKRCPARKCTALIRYEISADKCVGCTLCAKRCPVHCIAGTRQAVHVINQDTCIKCGQCAEVCRFGAVDKK
jgi:NADH:ubiquinone oxidoreductase subunit F (NADH-binding)/(2Fe-2S) ferredoxin